MYQRLLLLLLVLTGSSAIMAQDVMTPTDPDNVYNSSAPLGSATNPIAAGAGTMQKWVHSTTQKPGRITWNQSNFKSYRWGTMSFRLRFPNNYDPANNKYPIVIFLHGAGEAASVTLNPGGVNRENQDQLFWGAQLFEQRMNQGDWNGFLLFPQLYSNSSEWDGASNIPPVNSILDTLEKYNGLDPARAIVMGLSAGGLGAINYAGYFPKRIATIIPSSPEKVQLLVQNGFVPGMKEIPVWVSTGGLDNGPRPADVFATRDAVKAAGGDFYLSYYATHGHDTWSNQWVQYDASNRNLLSTYWNNAHKAQPMVYFQNSQFCNGGPISAPMGITPGFNAYEWQRDKGTGFITIPGANQNTYTATQVGTYRVRYQRDPNGAWSDWTPKPVVISNKACSLDTVIYEGFEDVDNYYTVFSAPGDANNSYSYQNITCQNGIVTNSTETFAQDATGRVGGDFMFYNTASSTSCTYVSGAQIWRYMGGTKTVTPNTNYLFTFYIGNHGTNYGNASNPVAALTPVINDVPLTPANLTTVQVGNASWKKLSYIWNSGSNSQVYQMSIINNTALATGNDFVIDELSLVKAPVIPMPGNAVGNVALWAKANSINIPDGSALTFWSNSALNGNNLSQATYGLTPTFKNNSTDNINFNPVVALNTTLQTNFKTQSGFAGTSNHNAANVYMVAKFNNIGQNVNIFDEATTATTWDSLNLKFPGVLTWRAGNSTNFVATPNNTVEANKPTLFTFSKDNINNTPNGNKQDIRKNGLVVASGNANSVFTGSTSGSFQLGTFDGNIAELVYVIDSQITGAEQNQVESYLALKYGISLGTTVNPVTYVASNGSTIWDGSALYQNDVFGIGTDSASGLIQTSSNSINSGSGNGVGISGKGNIVVTAASPLADKQFLTMGNDAASLAQTIIQSGQAPNIAVGSTRVGREWKVRNIGGVGQVTLSFDTTGLGAQAGGATVTNYALMVDNDGDGNFATGTIAFANATSASGKKIIFGNVTLNDNVVFSIITLKSALLPAIWLGFTAQEINGNALLNWKTSDEINVDRYTVEHSFNGVSFSAVGTVAANNNSGVNNYSFTHTGLTPGIHYYRIRRTDLDGKSEYTAIKTINVTVNGANVQVRPNPVVGSTLTLAITTAQNTKSMVQVMAVDGKVMMQQSVSLGSGTSLVNLDINRVPAGVYMVQVQLNNEVVTRKFIRQR